MGKKSSGKNNTFKAGNLNTYADRSYDTLYSHLFDKKNPTNNKYQTINTGENDLHPVGSNFDIVSPPKQLGKNFDCVRKSNTKSNFSKF